MINKSTLWLTVAGALALAACQRTQSSGRSMVLAPCRLKGVDQEAQCGTLEVWENRETKSGRKLHLNVAVVTSLAAAPQPDPLFVLAGGPGQSAVETAGLIIHALERVVHRRDVVFVDQRGTGKSNPLQCEDADGGTFGEEPTDAQNDAQLKKCLAGYDADVTRYTTPIAMDDLDDVRAALGYSKINLWGGSYGTRAALVYMRQHPEHVRTVTLDGVAPTDLVLPLSFAPDGQRALDLLFDSCASDKDCSAAYPDLKNRFNAFSSQLEKTPAKVKVADPVTGKVDTLTVTRRAFVTTLRGLLYIPEAASLMPLTIDRATRGDFTSFAAEAEGLTGGFSKSIAEGMFLSVICAEDVPQITPADIERSTRGTFLGRTMADEMLRICAYWPRGTVPAGYSEPVKSDVPTLLLSGELDPVTPPEHAAKVASHLPHSLHLVIPGVGHGATTSVGCISKVISDFIEAGTVEGLDTSCTGKLKRPPFVLSFAGPTP